MKRKSGTLFLVFIILSFNFAISTPTREGVSEIEVLKDEESTGEQFIVNKISGEVEKLPWENHIKFINAQKKYICRLWKACTWYACILCTVWSGCYSFLWK